MKLCSSCKTGEIFDVPAVFKVSGYHVEERRPYRALLCEEHFEMMHDYLIRVKAQRISFEGRPRADHGVFK